MNNRTSLYFVFATLLTFCLLSTLSCQNASQDKKDSQMLRDPQELYFGQETPGIVPRVFAPGIISKEDRYEFGFVKSKDGREVYFGVDNNGIMEIYQTTLSASGWSDQIKLFDDADYSHNDPMLSLNGEKLFFISDRPLVSGGDKKDVDIWYSERRKDSWSDPINLGTTINSPRNEYYVSFTADGSIYFASRDKDMDAPRYAYDIYKAEYRGRQYSEPVPLPKEVNTDRYEADVFVSPDESYLIFCSIRKDGLGNGDLYISFNDQNGGWTQAVNMGKPINTEGHELCPFVSQDGKYFFYTSNKDIYWVSTEIFKKYKKEVRK